MSLPDTHTLSISSKKIDSQCQGVADTLQLMGLAASVIPNRTIFNKNDTLQQENGCQIIYTEGSCHKVWTALKDKFDLDCAHLKIPGKYEGCIYDYHRQTNCPHQQD